MPSLTLSGAQSIHYRRIDGEGARPCLVFLHEGLGCSAMWGDFPQRLCDLTACPGLLYDRVGHGQSSPLAGARDARYLHEHALVELPAPPGRLLAPGQDYVIVGHSDGGSIGLIHAATRPPRLRALMTEAAHVFVEPETLAGIRVAVAAHAEGKLRGLARYHGERADALFRAWHEIWLDDSFRDWNIQFLLPEISVPTLVLQGADDQYGTRAQVDAIVSGIAAGGSLVRPLLIDDCGHVPHREQPGVVLQAMRDFLDGVPGRSA